MTAAPALVVQQSCEPVRELAKHQLALLDTHVAEINRLSKRAVDDAIEMGRRLHACRGIVGDGKPFDRFLAEKFNGSRRTAFHLISVYELAKSRSANFALLSLPLSAIYLMAAESTPPEAVDEVIEQAERGVVFKLDDVKEVIAEHKDRANGKTRPDFEELQAHVERLDPRPAPKPKAIAVAPKPKAIAVAPKPKAIAVAPVTANNSEAPR